MSEVVTFRWFDTKDSTRPRFATCAVPWVKNKKVQGYLHDQPLRSYSLIRLWLKSRTVNAEGRKIKLCYVPRPGDTIFFSPAMRVS